MTLVFIIGTGRCGSTMIHEVLAGHPDVGFMSNLDVNLPVVNAKGRWNNAVYRMVPGPFSQRDLARLRLGRVRLRFGPSEAYRKLATQVSPILAEPCRDLTAQDVTPWLRQRSARFFGQRMTAQGRPVFLCKFAGWPRAGFFHSIFPDAKFVRVIRDGRAVADSLIRRPWWDGYRGPSNWRFGPLPHPYAEAWESSGRSFVVLAGLQWALLMDAFESAKKLIPSQQWMDVRYEDFVDDPREEVRNVLRFIGLTWNDRFESAFRKYRVLADRKDEYRQNLTPAQLDLLDRVLGDMLHRFGYT
jgi:Sulfotransferase family